MSEENKNQSPNPALEGRARKFGREVLLHAVSASINFATLEISGPWLHPGLSTSEKGGLAVGTAVAVIGASKRKESD